MFLIKETLIVTKKKKKNILSTERELFSYQLKKLLSKSLVNNGFILRRTQSQEIDKETTIRRC